MIEKFSELLSNLNLKDEYSLIAVADGSGTTKDKPCGSKVYCNFKGKIQELQCSFSNGTNMFAELIPFVHVLWYYGFESFKAYEKVLFISDSEVVIKQGKREYNRSNQPLWGAIEAFDNYLNIYWQWVPRNSNFLSSACDIGAKEANGIYKTFYKCKNKIKESLNG